MLLPNLIYKEAFALCAELSDMSDTVNVPTS